MALSRLHHAFKHLTTTSAAATASRCRSAFSGVHRRRRLAGRALFEPGPRLVEHLEPRLFLTTVSGTVDANGNAKAGDVFEYRQSTNTATDIVVRVKLQGRITAELVGAQVSRRTNAIKLVNLPGTINGTPVFGGLAQPPGADVIGGVTIPGLAGATIQALASSGPGAIYALASRPVAFGTELNIIQLTLPVPDINGDINGGTTGTIISTITAPTGSNLPQNVQGADIAPNGDLYFTATTNGGVGVFFVTPSLANPLTPIDEVAQSLDQIPGVVPNTLPGPQQGNQAIPQVSSIAFNGQNLIGILNNAQAQGGGGGGAAAGSQLINIPLFDASLTTSVPIQVGGTGAVNNLTGLDIDNQGNIIAVQALAQPPNAQPVFGNIFQIVAGQNSAIAFNLGTADPLLSPTSLTFVPGLTDPFSGSTSGAFISFDGATRQLYFVNPIDRNPAQYLWNIYVTDADATGEISIGPLVDQIGNPGMAPFVGTAGDFRGFNAQSGIGIIVAPPGSTGQVLIGARTRDISPDIDDEDRIPFPEQPVPSDVAFATLPPTVETLNSGMIVESGNDVGKVLIGGTLTGEVDMRGSCDFFYAGWVITGEPQGQAEAAPLDFPDNFKVSGDLRSLVSRGAFGSTGAGLAAPTFLTGFDLQVGGSLGVARTYDAFYGHTEVNHLNNAPHFGRNQREWESHNTARGQGFENFNFGPSETPNPGAFSSQGDDFMYNDSFETAQYLGSIASSELGRAEIVRVHGSLEKTTVLQDPADYYAVSLMAGQTVRLRVRENVFGSEFNLTGDPALTAEDTENASVFVNLGVFDPDGRLIATDYNNVESGETQQQYFSFTADRPGIYRFAVAANGDAPGFSGGGLVNPGVIDYTLTAIGVGDIALGGIVANSTVFDLADGGPGIEVFRGDLGAVKSIGGSILSNNLFGAAVDVKVGNLRTLDAAAGIGETFVNDPLINVPEGSVGLVRSSGGPVVLNFGYLSVPAIGGDYQLIDGPTGTVAVQLIANRGIGVMRAGDMATPGPSRLEVNADDIGEDGIIDLIDVTGDMGTPNSGGPQITTHSGGNVRFIRVGGQPFRDVFFGNTSPEQTNISPGRSATIIDDSGSRMTFRSAGTAIPNTLFNPEFPNAGVEEFIGSRVGLITYPIRGSGGSVVINATSESGMTIAVEGGRTAEVGRVEIAGVGREVLSGTIQTDNTVGSNDGVQFVANDLVRDADSPTGFRQSLVLDPREDTDDAVPAGAARMSPDDLFLRVTGSARVDVLNVIVIDNGGHENLDIDGNVEVINLGDQDVARPTDLGNAISIVNDTGGDIINILAESVGELVSKGNVGIARSTTGMAVEGVNPVTVGGALVGRTPLAQRPVRATGTAVGASQPFLSLNEGVTINGNVISIRAGKAIGNIVVSDGSVGEVIANADGEDDPNQFEGINGVVYAAVGGAAITNLPGRINRVRIGEGILPSGSGNFQRAGLLAESVIGPVSGEDADIRGDIIALNNYRVSTAVNGTLLNPPNTPIERITLNNGSIINADIMATSSTGDSREFVGQAAPEFTGDESFNKPEFEIGRIRVIGNGGIIGVRIIGADVNFIEVSNGGFGIFNTDIRTTGDGTVNRVETTGYGLRRLVIETGRVGEIIANGDGTSLSTNATNSRVRFSEVASTDPQLEPLDPFFGFESNKLTDVGRFLGTNGTQPEVSGVTDTGVIEELEATGQRDIKAVRAWQIRKRSRIDFGNSVGTLAVRDIINGLELTTGTLKKFSLAQDAFALTITATGRVKKIDIKGSLAGNSVIRTQGDGGFDTVNVKGNLIGNINSNRAIKTVTIGGDFTGNVSVNAAGGTAIKTLKVGGAFIGGSLDVNGNVGTIQSAGSLGSLGDTLMINGNLNKLMVGGDLRANVRVTGNLKNLNVKGSIVDGGIEDGLVIDVSNTLTSLTVGGDIQQGVQVNAKSIKRQKIGGQNLGEFNIVQ